MPVKKFITLQPELNNSEKALDDKEKQAVLDKKKIQFIRDRQQELREKLGPGLKLRLDKILSLLKDLDSDNVDPDDSRLNTVVHQISDLCHDSGPFMFEEDLIKAVSIYRDLRTAIRTDRTRRVRESLRRTQEALGMILPADPAIAPGNGAAGTNGMSMLMLHGAFKMEEHAVEMGDHQNEPFDRILWERITRSRVGNRVVWKVIRSSFKYGPFRTGLDAAWRVATSRSLHLFLAILVGLGVSAVFMLAGAAIATAVKWNPLFGAIAGALGVAALVTGAWKRWHGPGGDAPSLETWKPTAIWGGAGLVLLGAHAAPAFVALLGVHALYVASIALIVGLALFYDALNGAHDAGNAIATIVATRTLSKYTAVVWAAFFNFIAFKFMGLKVATTVGSGLVDPHHVTNSLIVAALVGAGFWNWFTLRKGIPVSSSHSLIGGLVGAAVAAAGFGVLYPAKLIQTAIFMVVSPIIGLVGAGLLTLLMHAAAKIFGHGTTFSPAPKPAMASCNLFPRLSSASCTAPTTPKKPWALSRCCCLPITCWARFSMCLCGW